MDTDEATWPRDAAERVAAGADMRHDDMNGSMAFEQSTRHGPGMGLPKPIYLAHDTCRGTR